MEAEFEYEIDSDTILEWVKKMVKGKKANFDTKLWMDIALKLSILLGDEHAKLFDLQFAKAQKQLEIKVENPKMSVAETKLRIEATEIYRDYHKQKARVAEIEELIRVVKLQAKVTQGI